MHTKIINIANNYSHILALLKKAYQRMKAEEARARIVDSPERKIAIKISKIIIKKSIKTNEPLEHGIKITREEASLLKKNPDKIAVIISELFYRCFKSYKKNKQSLHMKLTFKIGLQIEKFLKCFAQWPHGIGLETYSIEDQIVCKKFHDITSN